MNRMINNTISNKSIVSFILFISLYFTNVGSKKIIQVFSVYNIELIAISILSVVSILIIIFSGKYLNQNTQILYLLILFLATYFFISTIQGNLIYGLKKIYLGLLLPVTLAIFSGAVTWKKNEIFKFVIYASVLISIVGILYKIKFGFFQRSVSFGLLGSIPFGWMMGYGIVSLIILNSNIRYKRFLYVFFLLQLLWCGSKGPLAALVLVLIFYYRKIIINKVLRYFVLVIITIFLFIFTNFNTLLIDISRVINIRQVTSVLRLIENPDKYLEGGGASYGTRLKYFEESLEYFKTKPFFGYGFGSFSKVTGSHHKYPHNIPLELLLETGLVGLILLLIVFFISVQGNLFRWFGYFGFLTLLFSGDFTYFRYPFFLLIVGNFISNQRRYKF